MSDSKSINNKHMTLDDRIEIQNCLERGMTFKSIANRIGKDQTTVSKEVKKHITVNTSNYPVKIDHNGKPLPITPCPQLLRAPFVCNGCKKRHSRCPFQKCVYYAKNAQQEYEALLKESREGIPLSKEEFYKTDSIITEGIEKGQHLYHIMKTHDLGVSQATVYRHLHKGYLSVSKMDFPRVVKFKPRKQHHEDKIPKSAKIGRTFQDFLSYIEENGITTWTEMDTVIGRIGGKVIMTFDFTLCNFMFGLLMDNKTAAEAARRIRSFKGKLLENEIRFGDIISLAITDNGGEFADVSAFIADADGEIETFLFFCDPYSSYQKPRVEKNHTLFRDIVPKGESFDSFTQDTVDLIFSHVNSVKRKSLNGKSPYEIFVFTFGEKVTSLLGIEYIPPEKVIQSPKLLAK